MKYVPRHANLRTRDIYIPESEQESLGKAFLDKNTIINEYLSYGCNLAFLRIY